MTVPPGFAVTLFAGEPDVVQPIAMTFDDRGRLWVVECLSYPNWRKDGKGSDRVTILEDTDGDGKFDKRTVFLDDGVNLSGIEIGFGGVWLCSSPNLLFIPDRDGDDKPDGPPEVVLDGWNIKDTKHNVFNTLTWGPDGWLYGCNGIQAKARVGKPGTPDKDRTPLDCGVWRYHPTQKHFELFASGTTNPWGLDWDDYGQMFITNCVIHHICHVIPGGHMERMYGDDVNPYTYGLQKSCADHLHWGGGAWTSSRSTGVNGSPQHSEAGGGHAHSGCAVYLGDNFPPEYRNSVFMCNIHGNRLNRDWLDRTPRRLRRQAFTRLPVRQRFLVPRHRREVRPGRRPLRLRLVGYGRMPQLRSRRFDEWPHLPRGARHGETVARRRRQAFRRRTPQAAIPHERLVHAASAVRAARAGRRRQNRQGNYPRGPQIDGDG